MNCSVLCSFKYILMKWWNGCDSSMFLIFAVTWFDNRLISFNYIRKILWPSLSNRILICCRLSLKMFCLNKGFRIIYFFLSSFSLSVNMFLTIVHCIQCFNLCNCKAATKVGCMLKIGQRCRSPLSNARYEPSKTVCRTPYICTPKAVW